MSGSAAITRVALSGHNRDMAMHVSAGRRRTVWAVVGVLLLGSLWSCQSLPPVGSGEGGSPDGGSSPEGSAADATPSDSDGNDGSSDSAATCTGDLLNDPKHCGRCGHDCLGGGCKLGSCQPVRLASGLTEPAWIAVDGTHVYVATSGQISRVPKTGGSLEPYVDTWGGSARSCSTNWAELAADGLWFHDDGIYSWLTGAPSATLRYGPTTARRVTTDAASVYFIDNRSLRELSKADGSVNDITQVPNSATFGSIGVDATHAYVADDQGRLYECRALRGMGSRQHRGSHRRHLVGASCSTLSMSITT